MPDCVLKMPPLAAEQQGMPSSFARPPSEVSDSRVASAFPVDVYGGDLAGRLPSRSRDLGIGGVCVETPSPFALSSVRRVVVTLPCGRLELDAVGRWQREASPEAAVLSGIDFLSPSREAVDRLWEVVARRGRELARHLAASPDLCGFGIEEAVGLAQLTRVREVGAGRTLYRQDTRRDGEDSLFLILAGRVALQARVRDRREVTLEVLSSGRVFGGLPLLADLPHGESALAASDVRLVEIDASAFRCLSHVRPWLAERLTGAVLELHAKRLHRLLARVGERL